MALSNLVIFVSVQRGHSDQDLLGVPEQNIGS